MSDLVAKIEKYLRQLAPHQKEREAAQLLTAAKNELSAMTQRAEAAESRIKASQEQKPAVVIVGVSKLAIEIADANGNDIDWSVLGVGAKFYSAPVIPLDVMKLLRENVEFTRKLGEQHNVLKYLMDRFDNETWQCENCGHAEDTATMDSAIYLREYLAAHPQSDRGSNE